MSGGFARSEENKFFTIAHIICFNVKLCVYILIFGIIVRIFQKILSYVNCVLIADKIDKLNPSLTGTNS
jgi:hypothetical protein